MKKKYNPLTFSNITKIITTKGTWDIKKDQVFVETPKGWEIWQRVHKIPIEKVLWEWDGK